VDVNGFGLLLVGEVDQHQNTVVVCWCLAGVSSSSMDYSLVVVGQSCPVVLAFT